MKVSMKRKGGKWNKIPIIEFKDISLREFMNKSKADIVAELDLEGDKLYIVNSLEGKELMLERIKKKKEKNKEFNGMVMDLERVNDILGDEVLPSVVIQEFPDGTFEAKQSDAFEDGL